MQLTPDYACSSFEIQDSEMGLLFIVMRFQDFKTLKTTGKTFHFFQCVKNFLCNRLGEVDLRGLYPLEASGIFLGQNLRKIQVTDRSTV